MPLNRLGEECQVLYDTYNGGGMSTELEVKSSPARRKLSPEQIRLAEWLAFPKSERSPKTQKELAKQLNVTPHALLLWKKKPEVWMVRDEVMGNTGKEMVPEALAVLRESMKSPNAKVAFEAAKDVLNRWSDPEKHKHIIDTIQAMYEHIDKT